MDSYFVHFVLIQTNIEWISFSSSYIMDVEDFMYFYQDLNKNQNERYLFHV